MPTDLEVAYSSFFTQKPIFHSHIHSPKLIWVKHYTVSGCQRTPGRCFAEPPPSSLTTPMSEQFYTARGTFCVKCLSIFLIFSCYQLLSQSIPSCLKKENKNVPGYNTSALWNHKGAFWSVTARVMEHFNWMPCLEQPAVQRDQFYLKLLEVRKKEMVNSKKNSIFMRQNETVFLEGNCRAREG